MRSRTSRVRSASVRAALRAALVAGMLLFIVVGAAAEDADIDETGTAPFADARGLAYEPRVAHDPVPAEVELAELLNKAKQQTTGELLVSDVLRAGELYSIAQQQREHVRRSVVLSLAAPGLGHYINSNTGRALAFASAELAVQITAGVAYFLLLPAPVRIANLNYLQTPIGEIEARWKSLTPSQLIPSTAVAVTGAILSTVVRSFAARDARVVAMKRLRSGELLFEPAPVLTPPPAW